MSGYDGELRGNELWYRCEECGDSVKHPDKAHCSVNLYSGYFNCLRCGHAGLYDPIDLFELQMEYNYVADEPPPPPYTEELVAEWMAQLKEGPARDAKGKVRYCPIKERYHFDTPKGQVDAFLIRQLDGEITGIHMRSTWEKKARTKGLRTFIYAGPSKFVDWVRIVEGPYDIVDPEHDVAVIGLPGSYQAKQLQGTPILLAVDGDVWKNEHKIKSVTKFVRQSHIFEAEIYRDGEDPGDNTGPLRVLNGGNFQTMLDNLRKKKKTLSTLSPEDLVPGLLWEDPVLVTPEIDEDMLRVGWMANIKDVR